MIETARLGWTVEEAVRKKGLVRVMFRSLKLC
jgi:hypothetical protein